MRTTRFIAAARVPAALRTGFAASAAVAVPEPSSDAEPEPESDPEQAASASPSTDAAPRAADRRSRLRVDTPWRMPVGAVIGNWPP